MCENHDGLSRHSISEQRRLHSPSVDEQETEQEPSLEQDEDRDQEQDQMWGPDKDYDGDVTPSRKKEIMVTQHMHHVVEMWDLWISRATVPSEFGFGLHVHVCR